MEVEKEVVRERPVEDPTTGLQLQWAQEDVEMLRQALAATTAELEDVHAQLLARGWAGGRARASSRPGSSRTAAAARWCQPRQTHILCAYYVMFMAGYTISGKCRHRSTCAQSAILRHPENVCRIFCCFQWFAPLCWAGESSVSVS